MKKAQGALEFLMTYGWAFLVILIMIGALAYFGVLNPSKYLPDKCIMPVGMSCDKDRMILQRSNTGTAIFEIKNGLMDTITLTNIRVNTDSNVIGSCNTVRMHDSAFPAGVVVPTVTYNMSDGGTAIMNISCTSGQNLISGNKVKFTVTFDYYPASAGPLYYKNMTGEFTATVR
mgnify:CR=1 FL=1